jgi:hypothetical protein
MLNKTGLQGQSEAAPEPIVVLEGVYVALGPLRYA